MQLNRETIKERIEEAMILKMHNKSIQFALDTVRKAYKGTLWIVGGTVTDTAVETMYNIEMTYSRDLKVGVSHASA
ncbi:MAG: hypothetical protein KKF46_03240 [Nanoarchaeota archaeon]|nr:hypothetical protein [Nanoarchaeota archaeon]MBU1321348.1 hypothetical protein [Nanoarchaeota archaeon]MBU1597271.1 hypothetical protein [Nanoarchaeota archaeon]MBU2441485.1 hypothetical protein [Nanoarchaeota archaeon]